MKLKNFPAGYVGRFHGRFASNINNFLGSDFSWRIANDAKYSFLKTSKNIHLQGVILERECKQTLMIT